MFDLDWLWRTTDKKVVCNLTIELGPHGLGEGPISATIFARRRMRDPKVAGFVNVETSGVAVNIFDVWVTPDKAQWRRQVRGMTRFWPSQLTAAEDVICLGSVGNNRTEKLVPGSLAVVEALACLRGIVMAETGRNADENALLETMRYFMKGLSGRAITQMLTGSQS